MFSGNVTLYFIISLNEKGGSPVLKKHSLSKIIKIKERLDVYDVWGIRNPKVKHFAFRQKHYSGYIQRRLDYIFILKNLQQLVKTTEILNAFSSNHSPVFCSILSGYNF